MSEEVGPTCLYKDGEAKVFHGEEVAEKLSEGWADQPGKKRGRKPKNTEENK